MSELSRNQRVVLECLVDKSHRLIRNAASGRYFLLPIATGAGYSTVVHQSAESLARRHMVSEIRLPDGNTLLEITDSGREAVNRE